MSSLRWYKVEIAHRTELKVNNKQRTYFAKACGIARFSWNWGLAQWEIQYRAGLKPSGMQLKKEFNALKEEQFPWIYEVTKYAAQQPFLNLQEAWIKFFEKKGGKPKFKKKGKCRDSFYIGGDQIEIEGKKIRIPNLGWVRMREELRYPGKINSVVISRTADRWFAAIQVESSIKFQPCKNQASVGVDFGINRLATLSNGVSFTAPKPLKTFLPKLRRLQRKLSKKEFRSRNYKKQKMKIACLHKRIADIRLDTLHKISTYITSTYGSIGIEDLHVKGMVKNHCLARAISDLGLSELRRQIEYKTSWRGNKPKIHDPFFPSSKICSQCFSKNENLTLSDRRFVCPHCSYEIDRDLNAAKNLNPVPGVPREFKPEEMTALLRRVSPVVATSIVETGNQPKLAC